MRECTCEKTRLILAIALASLSLSMLASGAAAAEETVREDWRERSRLTGDWGGLRDRLESRGVDLYAEYTAGFWSNVHGGFETGTRYEGFATFGVELDLGPLLDWEGGRVHVGVYSYQGGYPSTELVGTFSTTFLSGWEAERFIRFYEIFLEKEWLDGRVRVRGGQLAADVDFFISDYSASLLNATYGFLGRAQASQIGPFYPLAAPGLFLEGRSGRGWFGRAGAYVADVGEEVSGNQGFDWHFDEGGFFIGEFGLERSPLGLPGRYLIGAAGTTASVADYSTGGRAGGEYGVYGVIDQAVLMGPDGRPKLGSFLRVQFVPDEALAAAHWLIDGGFELRSPLPRRARDAISFGVSYLDFGSDYVSSLRNQGSNVSEYQLAFELAYRARVTNWLTLHPDMQYFVEPHLSRRNAFVIGLRAVIDL